MDAELSSAAFWLFVSVLAAIAAGVVAHRRGLTVFWIVFSCLFCWPIGLLFALVLPANKSKLEERAFKSGASKQCPYCAEIIRAEAQICPHCRQSLGMARSHNPSPAAQAAPNAGSDLEIYNCPHCSNKCLITKDLTGQEVSCPHCSNTFYTH